MFTPHVIDLAAAGYLNQDVYIAWRNTSNDEFVLVVDNVQITEWTPAGDKTNASRRKGAGRCSLCFPWDK